MTCIMCMDRANMSFIKAEKLTVDVVPCALHNNMHFLPFKGLGTLTTEKCLLEKDIISMQNNCQVPTPLHSEKKGYQNSTEKLSVDVVPCALHFTDGQMVPLGHFFGTLFSECALHCYIWQLL